MSTAFIFSITAIGVRSTYRVLKNDRVKNINIREENPTVASLYELLKTSSTMCLLYQSIFLLRRTVMAMILIFMKDSKVGQVISMIVTSLVWLQYIVKYQPFEEPTLNKLEIFNEIIIVTCLYHLLMFTQGLTYDENLIYKTGWSMDILLMVQFIVNIVSLGYNAALKVKAFIHRAWRIIALKRLKAMQER
jgi:hypothetical protein